MLRSQPAWLMPEPVAQPVPELERRAFAQGPELETRGTIGSGENNRQEIRRSTSEIIDDIGLLLITLQGNQTTSLVIMQLKNPLD